MADMPKYYAGVDLVSLIITIQFKRLQIYIIFMNVVMILDKLDIHENIAIYCVVDP